MAPCLRSSRNKSVTNNNKALKKRANLKHQAHKHYKCHDYTNNISFVDFYSPQPLVTFLFLLHSVGLRLEAFTVDLECVKKFTV